MWCDSRTHSCERSEAEDTNLCSRQILTQDICAVCAIDLQTVERIAASMRPRPNVVSLNPLNLDDVLSNILQVGEAVGLQDEARAAHGALVQRIETIDALVSRRHQEQHAPAPRVALIEWPDPLYVGGHWTPQLIERAGGLHPLNAGGVDGGGKSFRRPQREPHATPLLPCTCPIAPRA